MEMTGAEILVRCLQEEKVEHLFGYPGGAVLYIYDEIFKQKQVKHILVRHEQAAVPRERSWRGLYPYGERRQVSLRASFHVGIITCEVTSAIKSTAAATAAKSCAMLDEPDAV